MKVFFIGFGQAGGKIVDRFIEFDNRTNGNSFRAIVVNTARTDLMGLQNLDFEDRVLIGQTSVKGHGVGTDNDTGAQITFDEIDIIMNAIDRKGIGDTEAFIIVSGLGGGTGSGGFQRLPVLCATGAVGSSRRRSTFQLRPPCAR